MPCAHFVAKEDVEAIGSTALARCATSRSLALNARDDRSVDGRPRTWTSSARSTRPGSAATSARLSGRSRAATPGRSAHIYGEHVWSYTDALPGSHAIHPVHGPEILGVMRPGRSAARRRTIRRRRAMALAVPVALIVIVALASGRHGDRRPASASQRARQGVLGARAQRAPGGQRSRAHRRRCTGRTEAGL